MRLLLFVNFSAEDESILKISLSIIKRRSWGFQNTPNLQNSDYFELSYGNLKKMEDPEDSEAPPEINFLMSIGQENSKNKVAQKLLV